MYTIHTPLSLPITLHPCRFSEYKKLGHFHYRAGLPGPVDRCFGLSIPSTSRISCEPHLIGIIVYSMPPLNSRLRNLATRGRFCSAPTLTLRAKHLNRELRTISRVIIHPQFRSLGLAHKLVRHTLPLLDLPFIEASAVMGRIHPFFERAGMTRFDLPPSPTRQKLLSAFEQVNISRNSLLDPTDLHQKIASLRSKDRQFLIDCIHRYYVIPRRAVFSSKIRPQLDWLLPRLCSHLLSTPAYFLWQNPDILCSTH